MSRVELRPTISSDFADLVPDPLPYRTRALTAVLDGKVLGIGGIVFRPDGVWASLVVTDEARRYKTALHRAARRTLADARAAGIKQIYAAAEDGRHGAEAWLLRLGFEPHGNGVFVWKA